jgi:hypothetical protein
MHVFDLLCLTCILLVVLCNVHIHTAAILAEGVPDSNCKLVFIREKIEQGYSKFECNIHSLLCHRI